MTSLLPIVLQGRVLGERHRHLNMLVSEAYKTNEPLELVLSSPESGPVDRLFKIELASKHRHVDYILQNLRDDDMLYVSRALKSKWLLEDAYRHIMNPHYLEDTLYPNMLTQAVNNMKHWIHLNLTDPATCHRFYQYYCLKDPHIAFKFLLKCPVQVVEQQCSKWFDQMAPEYFKPLCERSALVAKIFFKSLFNNKSLQEKYLNNKEMYFEGLMCILKTNLDMFLDIIETKTWYFPILSRRATKFIMKHKKDRFLQKPELYAVDILHMSTLAQCLTPEDCEELVLKIARAKFLKNYCGKEFSYYCVEPLIKRVDVTKRDAFKKRVFVDKDIGEEVKEWPYTFSADTDYSDTDSSEAPDIDDNRSDVFEDKEQVPCLSEPCPLRSRFKCASWRSGDNYASSNKKYKRARPKKLLLKTLFDEYRFLSFKETLVDLQKKIPAESLPINRMLMFLVLVSKSGGSNENLQTLMEFMTRHRNEPAHVRAAVVRSLVKRASVWRVTDDIWESLLEFAEGLGLDGSSSDCKCVEGLHAVVIRSLLSTSECSSAIKKAYHNNFSTFTSYSLTAMEKGILFQNLVKLLMESATSSNDPYEESLIYSQVLKVIEDCKRTVDLDFIMKIKVFAANNEDEAENILWHLFKSKIGRKELFEENFGSIHTGDSYMNALKHKTDILSAEDFVNFLTSDGLNAGHFLRKVNIYFGEKGGLRDSFLAAIMDVTNRCNPNKIKYATPLARALVYLIGKDLGTYILKLDAEKSKESKLFSAQVREHAHVARPTLSVDYSEWRQFGAKYIANKVLGCRQADIDNTIKQLLMWRRTAKLAITLSKRTNYEIETLKTVANLRPTAVLKLGLLHIRKQGDNYDPRIWEIIKPLLPNMSKKTFESYLINYSLTNEFVMKFEIPKKVEPEYFILNYNILKKFDIDTTRLLDYIMRIVAKIDEEAIENILLDYLDNEFVLEKMNKGYDYDTRAYLHLTILSKHLLLCTSEQKQIRRFQYIGLPYLNRLEYFWKSSQKKSFLIFVNYILNALKYTEVFLNQEYIDCVPMMVKIVKWMQSFLPMEQYFNYYVDLHLTMSYCRAIRQSVKQAPEAFSDKKTRLNEGVKIVGEIFGRYIGHEAHELRLKYFDSIIELYATRLKKYLSTYFHNGIRFMEPYIIKSLINSADDIEIYLGANLLNNRNVNRYERKEIVQLMKQKNDTVSQFLFNLFKA